jgi:predicted PurR-regulated permease PerM
MADILAPFAAAFLLAYLLEPLCSLLEKTGLPRALASLAAIVVGTLLVVGFIAVGLPVVDREFAKLQTRLPDLLADAYGLVYPQLRALGLPIDDVAALREKLIGLLNGHTAAVSQKLLLTLQAGLNVLVTLLGWLVLVPVVLFFLLKDWARIFSKALLLVPAQHQHAVSETGCSIHQTLQAYLKGQALVMLALAVYYATALFIGGLQSWLSIGILTGLLVFIPYIGFAIGLTIAMVSATLELGFFPGLLTIAVVYGLGQLLESFYLTPKLIGHRIGLHPLAVIFALMFFGGLFGLLGVLLALPMAAVSVVIGQRLINSRADPPGR